MTRPLIQSLRRRSFPTLLAASLALGCNGEAPDLSGAPVGEAETLDPPAEGAAAGENQLRTVYVPAYSHLPRESRQDRLHLFSILLSVRNVDTRATITLTHVDYFDTSGHRVRRYLDAPRALRPLETAEFAVATYDEVGGSGANFLVYWHGPSDVHPLLTEAVMLGHLAGGNVAFTSRGVDLDRRPDPTSFIDEETPTEAALPEGTAPVEAPTPTTTRVPAQAPTDDGTTLINPF